MHFECNIMSPQKLSTDSINAKIWLLRMMLIMLAIAIIIIIIFKENSRKITIHIFV